MTLKKSLLNTSWYYSAYRNKYNNKNNKCAYLEKDFIRTKKEIANISCINNFILTALKIQSNTVMQTVSPRRNSTFILEYSLEALATFKMGTTTRLTVSYVGFFTPSG